MKTPRDLKASLYLLLSVFLVIILFLVCTSCSTTYRCPTYSGVKKEKYKKFNSCTSPIFANKKHF